MEAPIALIYSSFVRPNQGGWRESDDAPGSRRDSNWTPELESPDAAYFRLEPYQASSESMNKLKELGGNNDP